MMQAGDGMTGLHGSTFGNDVGKGLGNRGHSATDVILMQARSGLTGLQGSTGAAV